MKKRGVVFAFIVSSFLTGLIGILSNLATTYIAPSLENYSIYIYFGLGLVFVVSLVISTIVFIRSIPEDTNAIPDDFPPKLEREQIPPKLGQLPEKPFRELIGRDLVAGEIMSVLRDPAGKWMVGLDGIGGIGKTALAREIADLCQKENLFDIVIWEQAPKERDRWGANSRGALTFEAVLDSIARQLGGVDILPLKFKEKLERIRTLIRNRRLLIVLDNLETAGEDQNEISVKLLPLLNPAKAILTSRHRFEGDIYSIHMDGLAVDSALRFIRGEARERNIERVSSAAEPDLRQIVQITGGSPLAMTLVIGQLINLPLHVILNNLKDVKLSDDTPENEYVRFYKSIFMPSWELLSRNAQKLLIAMANFAPNVGGTYDALLAASDLPDELLPDQIDELWRFSFLDVGKSGSLNKVRYYLHALTQNFVLSDIVKIRG